jgi:hypothetical protein
MDGHMPRRITITLPDTVAGDLQRWADARGQAIATAAAISVELAIREAKDRGEFPKADKPDLP